MSHHARGGEGTRRGRCEMSNIRLRGGDTLTTAERGREFWRGVLLAGGFTALPRWTLNPLPGVSEHQATIPDELVAAVASWRMSWRCRSVRCCCSTISAEVSASRVSFFARSGVGCETVISLRPLWPLHVLSASPSVRYRHGSAAPARGECPCDLRAGDLFESF